MATASPARDATAGRGDQGNQTTGDATRPARRARSGVVSDEACSVIVLRAGGDLAPAHARALGPLTALLASAIDELGDATAVLHLAPPGAGKADRSAPGGVRHIWLPPPSDRRVEPTVRAALA